MSTLVILVLQFLPSFFHFKPQLPKFNFKKTLSLSLSLISNEVFLSASLFLTPCSSLLSTLTSPLAQPLPCLIVDTMGSRYLVLQWPRNHEHSVLLGKDLFILLPEYGIGVYVRFWEGVRHLKLPNPMVGFHLLCLIS